MCGKKSGTISQEELRKELEEMKLNTAAKDIEISKLQMIIKNLSREGLSIYTELRIKYVELKKRAFTLTDEVLNLNA